MGNVRGTVIGHVDKHPRATREHGMREPRAHTYVSSYSNVGAIEQRCMVNSGVRGAKDKNLRTEVH